MQRGTQKMEKSSVAYFVLLQKSSSFHSFPLKSAFDDKRMAIIFDMQQFWKKDSSQPGSIRSVERSWVAQKWIYCKRREEEQRQLLFLILGRKSNTGLEFALPRRFGIFPKTWKGSGHRRLLSWEEKEKQRGEVRQLGSKGRKMQSV